MRTVARISITPVRTFRLTHPQQVFLGLDGVPENRRFMLVDGEGNRLRSSLTAWPIVLSATYDAPGEVLSVSFPDGSVVVESALRSGEPLHPTVGDRAVTAHVVPGAWEKPMSELAGHLVRIVRLEAARDAFTSAATVTLLSDGSIRRLSQEAERPVDARRFRMLFELDGCAEHEEDTWTGGLVRLGEAVVRVGGQVDRCAATTRHPETGERDLDTLRLIKDYRGQRLRDGAICFGMLGDVEEPGAVCVGDPVEPL